MPEQHDGQITAPTITQDPTSSHFGPAPLSTWNGTELEWVLLHGHCRRACRERGPLFGVPCFSNLKGAWSGRWTQRACVTRRGTGPCWHSPGQLMNSALCPAVQHWDVWQEAQLLFIPVHLFLTAQTKISQKYTHPFADELGDQFSSRGNFLKR